MRLTVHEILDGFVNILLMQTNVNHMLAYLNALWWHYSDVIEIDYILPVELYQQEIICKDPLLTSLLPFPSQTELDVTAFISNNREVCNYFWENTFWRLSSLNFLSKLLVFYILSHEF